MDLLSLESEILGLRVCDEQEIRSRDLPQGLSSADSVILLVHGFKVSDSEARASFRAFERALQGALGFRSPTVLGNLCGVIWPGDHEVEIVSKATYPARIPDAFESGRRLALALGRLRPDQNAVLVGHSLGCRVVLAALREIRAQGDDYEGARVVHAFLLAAAVPEFHCLPSAVFAPADRPETDVHVLYSHRDSVLTWAFPPGQYLYDSVQPSIGETDAVGLSGGPKGRWTSHHETSLGHGAYWASWAVAKRIVNELGYPAGLIDEGHPLPENALPTKSRFPGRRLPVRGVLGM